MRGEWNLREWETEYWCSFFKKKIEYLKAGHSEKIDLTKLTVVELKKLAKDKNIEGYSKMKKDELISSLK